MPRLPVNPADTPAEAYHHWHRQWCKILTRDFHQQILEAGLAGKSFTERVPDAPDGSGYFSYAFDERGQVGFIEGEGQAVAEYDSYELGLRMLSDASVDGGEQIAAGRFRILSEPESWQTLMSLLPILRIACRQAIEETERALNLTLAKYW
jgi:hypothetical protein